jgi:flagellar motor protein MotB
MLKEIVSQLQESTGDIIIAGYSDNQPILSELKRTYPSDRELSFAKAMAVLDYLQSCGISRDRLVCIGYGSSKPIDSNETLEGKSRNRRVEIIVKELTPAQSSTPDSIISPISN